MTEPAQIATDFTFGFVHSALPAFARRVLEVGCGDGRLAARLAETGLEVVAIDADEDAVRRALLRRVDARCVDWFQFADPMGFDAILFTRSLHHIAPLDEAVARSARLLTPDGVLIGEDLAFDEADETTVEWLRSRLRDVRSAASVRGASDCLAQAVLLSDRPMETWRAYHCHDEPIHPFREISNALRRRLGTVTQTTVPYLFRYVCTWLDEGPNAAQIVREFLDLEAHAISVGAIRPIGRRFVAQTDRRRSTGDEE